MKRNLAYVSVFLLILLMVASVGLWEHRKPKSEETFAQQHPHINFVVAQAMLFQRLGISDPSDRPSPKGVYRSPDGTPVVCMRAQDQTSFIASANYQEGVFLLSSSKDNVAAYWIVNSDGTPVTENVVPLNKVPKIMRTYARKLDSGEWDCSTDYNDGGAR